MSDKDGAKVHAMLIYLIVLATAAAVLLAVHSRSEINRWAAFFLLSAALGGLPRTVFRTPDLAYWAHLSELLNHTLTPCGVLLFAIVYAETAFRPRIGPYGKAAVFLPAAATILATLPQPGMALNFKALLIWTVTYYLAACYLLVQSYARETQPRMKRNRLITVLITVPTLLGVIAFINVAKAISPAFDFFRYISVFIVYSFALAGLCVFVYGVLGVKVRIERDSLQGALKTARMSSGVLNHAVKNEVGKIAIGVENAKRSIGPGDTDAGEHLDMIASAASHLMEMAGRVHSRTRELAWQAEPCRLDLAAAACLDGRRGWLEERGVRVGGTYAAQPEILADPVHLREAIGNLLANAAEAMPCGGTIEIAVEQERKAAVLRVRDTGSGIPQEELRRVWEPFYSTKQGKANYGLGLSYVYQVMEKSGGEANIASSPGTGTVVTLRWPLRRRKA
ncbi:HAMP domain-containing sensor histidine kinase [Cohnella sp. REN36]|uniref:sensor histidine kinase n=1 Tax=Cohnella sp. REN36 TaxID=2887347 RepID=UPI001D158605|nr:HAMP domain-containing sensor histidine kinase [Cohnella sp. REN36]MCC3374973.1 HAMP domain-containing histidine kinase [Cohnella sp. REN36]